MTGSRSFGHVVALQKRRLGLLLILLISGSLCLVNDGLAQPPSIADESTEVDSPTSDSPTSDSPTSDSPTSDSPAPDSPAPDDEQASIPDASGESTTDVPRTDDSDAGIRLPLPSRSADGRTVYGVGLYLSQMSDLLPKGYRAVALDQLADALRRPPLQSKGGDAGRLKSALYDVRLEGDTLTSDGASHIEIQTRRSGVVRRSLGRVNWALTPPERGFTFAESLVTLPRLETDASGDLSAVFEAAEPDQTSRAFTTKIPVSWKYRGNREDDVLEFDLELPRIPRTKIILSAPIDSVVETLDGVLRNAPQPPPEAEETSRSGPVRWYEIEAGGLGLVRLRIRSREVERINRLVVMRRESLQYDIAMSGVRWSHRMTLQIPRANLLPTIKIPNGTVTSISVNSVATRFSRRVNDDGSSSLIVDVPLKPYTSTKKLTTLNITGTSSWALEDPRFPLPKCELENCELIPSQSPIQVRATLEPNLSIVSWDLPKEWTQQIVGLTALGQTSLYSEGPSPDASPAVSSADSSGNSDATQSNDPSRAVSPDSWSSMHLAVRQGWQTRQTLLKLLIGDVESDRLTQATAQIRLEFEEERLLPIRLEVQPGWNVTSITFPHSGRVVENPKVDPSGQRITVWPESDDLDGNALTIKAFGRQYLGDSRRVTVPSTWFVRAGDGQGTFLAAVVPPEQMKWSSETSMLDRVVTFASLSEDSLSESEREFLESFPPEMLLVRRSLRDTPTLTLLRPNVSPDVAVETWLQRDGNEAVETLSIETDSVQLPDEFSIVFGAGDRRPSFRWSLVADDEGEAISLPGSDVLETEDSGQVTHTVSLTDHRLRNLRLVGKRRYRIDDGMTLALPNVRGAANQDAEVLVSSDWVVHPLSNSILKVPAHRDSILPNGASLDTSPAQLAASDRRFGEQARQARWLSTSVGTEVLPTRLRYDPVSQPLIRVTRPARDPRVTVIWDEDIEISASSRGSDSIRATYRVSSQRPVEIQFDDNLQLVSASRNGRELLFDAPEAGKVTIQPDRDTDIIRLAWTRVRLKSSWLRHCIAPSIQVDGVLLRSRYRLTAASDTFALGAIGRSTEKLSGGRTSLSVTAGSSRVLVHRNLAIGFGWLVAGLVFSFAWYCALQWRLGFVAVMAVVVLSGSAAVLWWPWQLSLVGWMVLPCCAAALLQASRIHHRRRVEQPESDVTGSTNQIPVDPSGEFSISGPMSLCLIGITLSLGTSTTFAQSTGVTAVPGRSSGTAQLRSSRDRPINVLVPVDAEVQQVGDKVYVSDKTYRDYFAAPDDTALVDPFFESADYRVDISSLRDSKVPAAVLVTAEYVVHLERPGTLLRLPFQAPSVRRIELLQSDQFGIKQFETDENGQVIINLPRSDVFRLRLTLVPKITFTENEGEMVLSVPPIHSSRLTVATDDNIDLVSLESSTGTIRPQRELGRWVADLGPSESIQITFRSVTENASELSLPMRRVYRVHAGKVTTVVECEVTPPQKLEVGDQLPLVILENPSVFVTTSAWRLDQTTILSPARYSLTFTKLIETDEPLSLAWKIPSAINDPTSQDERIVTSIPEVLPSTSSDNVDPPIIGISGDVEVRISRVNDDDVTNMTADVFYSHWKGYRAVIDRALSTQSSLPELILLREKIPRPLATQSHRLHIGPQRMQLEYEVEITDVSPSVQRRMLELPRAIRLQEVTINGIPVEYEVTQLEGRKTLSIRDDRTDGSITVGVKGILKTPSQKRFQTPLIRLRPEIQGKQEYLITRQRETAVRVVAMPQRAETIDDESYAFSMAQLQKELLGQGQIPVLRWTSDSSPVDAAQQFEVAADSQTSIVRSIGPAQLIVSGRSNRISTDQLIALNFDQGHWVMNTAIRFGNTVPDFIDVELPRRWCDALRVEPESAWMMRDSMDPEQKIVRVVCDPESMKQSALILHGELDNTDQDRISVPSIRILGEGRRRVQIAVPRRLTNEPITWQRRAVKPNSLPPSWQNLLAGSELEQLDESDLYVADSESWSVDMQPLPNTTVDPVVVSADAKICVRDDDAIVICQWDVVPERLESIDIRLPRDAEFLGAWSADKSVDAELVQENELSGANGEALAQGESVLRVPLALSRLTQAVELIVRVPHRKRKKTGGSLPMPMGIELPKQWVSIYLPIPTEGFEAKEESGVDVSQSDAHAFALAQSVLQSIRRSLDSVAERRNVEVALWLESWVARYISLANSAGHRCDFSADPENQATGGAVGSGGWNASDREMSVFVNRYLSDVTRYQPPRFASSRLKGFRLQEIHYLDPLAGLPPLPRTKYEEAELRDFLGNLLTLAMVAGAFLLLWPLRDHIQQIIVHPALWLSLIGVAALFVAPLPVAIAILIAAVTLPTLQSLSARRVS